MVSLIQVASFGAVPCGAIVTLQKSMERELLWGNDSAAEVKVSTLLKGENESSKDGLPQ